MPHVVLPARGHRDLRARTASKKNEYEEVTHSWLGPHPEFEAEAPSTASRTGAAQASPRPSQARSSPSRSSATAKTPADALEALEWRRRRQRRPRRRQRQRRRRRRPPTAVRTGPLVSAAAGRSDSPARCRAARSSSSALDYGLGNRDGRIPGSGRLDVLAKRHPDANSHTTRFQE